MIGGRCPFRHDRPSHAKPRRAHHAGAHPTSVTPGEAEGRGKGVQEQQGATSVTGRRQGSPSVAKGRECVPWIPFPSLRSAGDDGRRPRHHTGAHPTSSPPARPKAEGRGSRSSRARPRSQGCGRVRPRSQRVENAAPGSPSPRCARPGMTGGDRGRRKALSPARCDRRPLTAAAGGRSARSGSTSDRRRWPPRGPPRRYIPAWPDGPR